MSGKKYEVIFKNLSSVAKKGKKRKSLKIYYPNYNSENIKSYKIL